MKKFIVILLYCYGAISASAQRFDSDVMALSSSIAETLEKDARKFDSCMSVVEASIAKYDKLPMNVKNATELSVLHAMAGWMYGNYADRSSRRNADNNYSEKSTGHWNHVLDHKLELANANANDFKKLVKFGADGELFNHDMLIVMANLYMKNLPYRYRHEKEDTIHNQLKAIYDSLGRSKSSDVLNDIITYRKCSYYVPQNRDSVLLYWRDMKKKYAKSRFFNHYVNEEKIAMKPYVNFSPISRDNSNEVGSKEFFANHPMTIFFDYWNCKSANITIREYDGEEKGKNRWQIVPRETGKVVKSINLSFGNDEDNKKREKMNFPVQGSDSISVTLPVGKYVFVYKFNGEKETQVVNMSTLRLLTMKDGNDVRCYVLDAISGKPVKGAKVVMTAPYVKNSVSKESVTNADGEAVIALQEKSQNYTISAYLGASDSVQSTVYYYKSKNNNKEEIDSSYMTRIYLDRSIYRPGQTVHGYAVTYRQYTKDKFEVAKNYAIDICCTNEDDDTIYEDSLTTNGFGSIDFSFKLPDDAKVGHYNVECDEEEAGFIVEEYKRPTWELSLEPVNDKTTKNTGVSFGDTVYVKGIAKSYSGVPVQGGTVEYKLTKSDGNFRYWFVENPVTYETGTLSVDDDGTFRVPMPLEQGTNTNSAFTRITLEVKVTDMVGETHEDSYSLRVFKNEFAMTVNTNNQIDLNSESDIVIKAFDALDNKVDVDVKCTLTLNNNVELSTTLPANKPFRISDLYGGPSVKIPVGTFKLKAMAMDKRDHEIIAESKFTVFDTNPNTVEKRRADFAESFFYVPCDTIKNGKSQIAYFCPVSDDVELYMFQGSNDKLNHCSHATYNKKVSALTVNPLQKDEESCSFTILYVKDGRVYDHSHSFVREVPEEKLTMSWSTFRDHLQPGQKETWKLKVNGLNTHAESGAEVLATMYDASLDEYMYHEWNRIRLVGRRRNSLSYQFSNNYLYGVMLEMPFKHAGVGRYVFDEFSLCDYLDQFAVLNHSYNSLREVSVKSRKSMAKSNGYAEPLMEVVAESQTRLRGVSTVSADEALQGRIAGLEIADNSLELGSGEVSRLQGNPDTDGKTITPRTNFAETAFFYPHLITDKNGEVEINFTLPESLTKWKFLGFAHDKNMKNGVITAEAISQKQFMVQPQMPRFIRVGDKATIATRIINQSDKALCGKAIMRLLHAKDESLISTQSVDFSVEAGKTTTVSFPLTAVSSDDDIICEIVAEGYDVVARDGKSKRKQSKSKVSQPSALNSQQFSDGERNLIPVLPSRMVITESVPFYIKGGEEKNINLSGLYNGNSKTADEKTMSIEYTANPVWTVVEALRDIDTPESPCATSLAASIYANSKLYDINSQLKPFTNKQIINTDTVSAKITKSWNALKSLLCSDGGFRWFPGFNNSSYYVTLSVAEQLVKLRNVKINNDGIDASLFMSYLDSVQVERYEYNKAHKIKITPSESDLHYLYVCSQYPDRKVSSKVKKIREEYLAYLERNIKELSIYGIASSANILRAFGHKASADKFLNTVRNYLVYDEGQGKHFESRRAQYSWRDYRIPTQVAAMNAFYAENPDDEALNDMTIWLLRQKQVQSWDNPCNTVDVADLLLKMNEFGCSNAKEPNASDNNPDDVLLGGIREGLKMSLNGKNLTSESFIKDNVKKDTLHFAEEIGYMNKQLDPKFIDNSANSLSVVSSTRGAKGGCLISWGAVSVTFTEDSENIKSYTTGEVKISRRIMVEKDGKWFDFNSNESLKVGQKVRVRHTLSTDRDMDYVRVKTLHPACFEPTENLSGYCWKGGTGCYQSIHDSYIEMFFERYREGTSTLDIDYFVTRPGIYNMGITTAECTYASSFGGHSGGMKVEVYE